jgi:hypothetical protein
LLSIINNSPRSTSCRLGTQDVATIQLQSKLVLSTKPVGLPHLRRKLITVHAAAIYCCV